MVTGLVVVKVRKCNRTGSQVSGVKLRVIGPLGWAGLPLMASNHSRDNVRVSWFTSVTAVAL